MELGTAIYPGTEIMTDVGSYRFVKAINGDHTVLVPQPSNDERDPLNWSSTRKGLTIFCITLMTFAQGFGPLSLVSLPKRSPLVLACSNREVGAHAS